MHIPFFTILVVVSLDKPFEPDADSPIRWCTDDKQCWECNNGIVRARLAASHAVVDYNPQTPAAALSWQQFVSNTLNMTL
jgi:hypothetical protein